MLSSYKHTVRHGDNSDLSIELKYYLYSMKLEEEGEEVSDEIEELKKQQRQREEEMRKNKHPETSQIRENKDVVE